MGAIAGAAIGAAAIIGSGLLGKKTERDIAAADRRLQYDFAQQGIQWRVADAKKAGVHPLYALGANIPTYSPVARAGGDSFAESLGLAGQKIGDAIGQRADEERRKKDEARRRALEDDRIRAETQLLRSQIAGQNLKNVNSNRPPVVGNQLIPGQSGGSGALRSYAGGMRVVHFRDAGDKRSYQVFYPGEATHQDLEDTIGASAELVSAARTFNQPDRRKKWGPHGWKRWRSDVKVEELPGAWTLRSGSPKRSRRSYDPYQSLRRR